MPLSCPCHPGSSQRALCAFKAARKHVLLGVLAACCLLLQGCDNIPMQKVHDYFQDPDVATPQNEHWEPRKLTHVKREEYLIDFDVLEKTCDLDVLNATLKRITSAYRKEAERVIPDAVPAKTRSRHLTEVFPKDPLKSFVKRKGQGLLNKEQVYCRTLYFFPEMDDTDRADLMVDAIQSQAHMVTQFLDADARKWWEHTDKNKRTDEQIDEYLDRIRKRFGLEELGKDHLIGLRNEMIKLTVDYYKSTFFAIEAFFRGDDGRGTCLTTYFMDDMEPCKFEKRRDASKTSRKAIIEANASGTKVANPAALTEMQAGAVNDSLSG